MRAVDEPGDRLGRIEQELLELAPRWRLYPVVQALQALRGVQWLVALTMVAELGDLTRFDNPRQLAAFVGLLPSEYSSGPTRRQGGITNAGNGRARRALIEAAWAYRHPANVSEPIQRRIDQLPKPIQGLGWKAQVRLCTPPDRAGQTRPRRRHRHRAGTDCLYVGDREGGARAGVTAARQNTQGRGRGAAPVCAQPSTTLRGDSGRPSCLE